MPGPGPPRPNTVTDSCALQFSARSDPRHRSVAWIVNHNFLAYCNRGRIWRPARLVYISPDAHGIGHGTTADKTRGNPRRLAWGRRAGADRFQAPVDRRDGLDIRRPVAGRRASVALSRPQDRRMVRDTVPRPENSASTYLHRAGRRTLASRRQQVAAAGDQGHSDPVF